MTRAFRGAGRRAAGRPRDASADAAIAAAAREILAEQGFSRMSMEQVAVRAGVAKTTLYRRWPTKSALVTDAVAQTFDSVEVADHGSLEADLRAGVEVAAGLLSDPSVGGAYAELLAQSARDPQGLRVSVRHTLAVRLHAIVGQSVERAVTRGELTRDLVDVDLLADVVVGAVMHRVLATGVADEAFVDALIEMLTDVAAARAQKRAGSR